MRKMKLAILGTVLTLAVGGSASAQPAPSDGPEGPGPRMGRGEGMARALGLTDTQKEQVRKLMEGRRAEHEALREQIEANAEQLKKALDVANPDPTGVGELAIEGHRLREQGKALRQAQDKAVRALLTPEQQVRFDAIAAMREAGGRGGFGPRGAHGRPAPEGGAPQP
jgi:Spy/CpxP family protein refolding chaperone